MWRECVRALCDAALTALIATAGKRTSISVQQQRVLKAGGGATHDDAVERGDATRRKFVEQRAVTLQLILSSFKHFFFWNFQIEKRA